MVAIAVIVAVITIIAAPATIAGVLGAISAGAGAISSVAGALGYNKVARIFGIIAVITGFGSVIAAKLGVGQSLFGFAIAREGTSKLFSPWTGIFLGVGSIFNSFSSNNDDLDDPVIFNITFTAISDAYEVFKKDPKCAKFFGLTDTKGRFSQKKLDQFLKDVKFKADVKGGPHVAQTVGKNVTFYGKFYNDGVFKVSPAPYSLKNPRQGRAQTVLHELGHVKGILLSNDAGGYPNDPNTRGNQNEKTILDNCGKGLAGLPQS
jgi:hypothetical protein